MRRSLRHTYILTARRDTRFRPLKGEIYSLQKCRCKPYIARIGQEIKVVFPVVYKRIHAQIQTYCGVVATNKYDMEVMCIFTATIRQSTLSSSLQTR